MPPHVSSTIVLIVRRSESYYTASGIVTPVGGRPVHRTTTYRVATLEGSCTDIMTCTGGCGYSF